jgi:hypothetical protein
LISGFGGPVVNMLASGAQDRDFEPGRGLRIFWAKKILLRRGSKVVCPMSQICGMLKNSVNYVEVGIAGQIYRPFLAPTSVLH